jgi:hypothetical protein
MDSSNPMYIYILDNVVITPNAINNNQFGDGEQTTHKNGAIKGMVNMALGLPHAKSTGF